MGKYSNLELRFLEFSSNCICLIYNNKKHLIFNDLFNQISRSSSSVSQNYGEACAAESNKDFIHKLQIVLKELRETYNSLRIIKISSSRLKSDDLELWKK